MTLLNNAIYGIVISISIYIGNFVAKHTKEELEGKERWLLNAELLLTILVFSLLMYAEFSLNSLFALLGFAIFFTFGRIIRGLKFSFPILTGLTIGIANSLTIIGVFVIIYYLMGRNMNRLEMSQISFVIVFAAMISVLLTNYVSYPLTAFFAGSLLSSKLT